MFSGVLLDQIRQPPSLSERRRNHNAGVTALLEIVEQFETGLDHRFNVLPHHRQIK